MSRRPKRRPPIQARAQATVADILASTARILEREGYDALTTNAIARVAGVGIGSLYQYFEVAQPRARDRNRRLRRRRGHVRLRRHVRSCNGASQATSGGVWHVSQSRMHTAITSFGAGYAR